jgi:hypothetical protein
LEARRTGPGDTSSIGSVEMSSSWRFEVLFVENVSVTTMAGLWSIILRSLPLLRNPVGANSEVRFSFRFDSDDCTSADTPSSVSVVPELDMTRRPRFGGFPLVRDPVRPSWRGSDDTDEDKVEISLEGFGEEGLSSLSSSVSPREPDLARVANNPLVPLEMEARVRVSASELVKFVSSLCVFRWLRRLPAGESGFSDFGGVVELVAP